MYVRCNIDERSYNHCCSEEAISIRYSESVFAALSIQHARRMRRIYCDLWPARPYNIFLRYIINYTIFEKKKKKSILT
jgi:hypothetical protein